MTHEPQPRPQAWLAFGIFAGLCLLLVGGLVFVVPVFAEMFADFGAELPKPTQALINASNWLKFQFALLPLALLAPVAFGYVFVLKKGHLGGAIALLWGLASLVLFAILCAAIAMFLPIFQLSSVVGQ